jgi:hypothetical protein
MIPKSSVADAFRTPTRDQALAFRFGFEDGTRVRWGHEPATPLVESLNTWDAAPFLCGFALALILTPKACEGCWGRGWATGQPYGGTCPVCDGRQVAVEPYPPTLKGPSHD